MSDVLPDLIHLHEITQNWLSQQFNIKYSIAPYSIWRFSERGQTERNTCQCNVHWLYICKCHFPEQTQGSFRKVTMCRTRSYSIPWYLTSTRIQPHLKNPCVLIHGDQSHPNFLRYQNGQTTKSCVSGRAVNTRFFSEAPTGRSCLSHLARTGDRIIR